MGRAIEVIDADDPRLAAYRNVSDAERLRSSGHFVAEGRLVVQRVLDDPRYRVVSVVVNEAARRDLGELLDRLEARIDVIVVEGTVLEQVAGYHVHRGCLALVERPPMASVDDVTGAEGVVVVLEGVTNADNVGGVFRNAAAFGAAGVVISPTCCDPLYRKAIRTSMGTVLRVPFARADSWPDALLRMRAAGRQIVALTPRAPAESIADFARAHRASLIALVAGTEGGGLTPAVEAIADARVCIPMTAGIDSLNVSVAVGIALYALTTRNV